VIAGAVDVTAEQAKVCRMIKATLKLREKYIFRKPEQYWGGVDPAKVAQYQAQHQLASSSGFEASKSTQGAAVAKGSTSSRVLDQLETVSSSFDGSSPTASNNSGDTDSDSDSDLDDDDNAAAASLTRGSVTLGTSTKKVSQVLVPAAIIAGSETGGSLPSPALVDKPEVNVEAAGAGSDAGAGAGMGAAAAAAAGIRQSASPPPTPIHVRRPHFLCPTHTPLPLPPFLSLFLSCFVSYSGVLARLVVVVCGGGRLLDADPVSCCLAVSPPASTTLHALSRRVATCHHPHVQDGGRRSPCVRIVGLLWSVKFRVW